MRYLHDTEILDTPIPDKICLPLDPDPLTLAELGSGYAALDGLGLVEVFDAGRQVKMLSADLTARLPTDIRKVYAVQDLSPIHRADWKP